MSDDANPIAPDQPILRKVFKGPGFYAPQKSPPIERGAFTPNKNDTDGLSFYLESVLPIEALIAASPSSPARAWLVIRFRAKDIYDLGLTLVRTTDPDDLPGHLVIPELNWNDYETRKTTLKPAIAKLASLAVHNIVFNEGRRTDRGTTPGS